MNNILSDFLEITPEGLYCKYGNFYIDPIQPVKQAVVSHAHGDHAVPGHGKVWATPATVAFMQYRHARHTAPLFEPVACQSSFSIGAVSLYFLPAGHMLGSVQVLMEYKETTYLYTGDYKLQPDDTCEPIMATAADVLITESTFADPQIKHPDPASEIAKINGQPFNILLGTYALGKAQRLTSLINTYCPGRTVLLHHSILPLHKLYEQFGVKPLNYQPYDRKLMKNGASGLIYLVPPLTFNSYFRVKNVVRVFASGWSHHHTRNDISLYISDHADWQDILHYIEQVNPREIWTLHGRGDHLQAHFGDRLPVKLLNK